MRYNPPMKYLTVYCGSRTGKEPAYGRAAEELGRELARRGWGLVYGGGRAGLMGIVADAVLTGGGPVIGVIPRAMMDRELAHRDLTELIVTADMHERKITMAARGHAFAALPGGIGTLEELFEVWTHGHLGYHAKPCGLLNVVGYWDPLLGLVDRMADQDFLWPETRDALVVRDHPRELLDLLLTP